MALRLRKRIKLAPGVRLNLSKSGGSLSVGPKGGTLNVSGKGLRATASIPKTGISYSKNLSSGITPKKKEEKRKAENAGIETASGNIGVFILGAIVLAVLLIFLLLR